MKFSWLIIMMALSLPMSLIAQSQNEQTTPNKKERVIGTPSNTFKKTSLKVVEAPVLSAADQQKMQDRAQLKENQIQIQQAEKEREAIYQEYLGVSSNKDPLYAAKKEALSKDNPQRFKAFKNAIQNSYPTKAVKTISREKYNTLSQEQQKAIKNHPTKYRIID